MSRHLIIHTFLTSHKLRPVLLLPRLLRFYLLVLFARPTHPLVFRIIHSSVAVSHISGYEPAPASSSNVVLSGFQPGTGPGARTPISESGSIPKGYVTLRNVVLGVIPVARRIEVPLTIHSYEPADEKIFNSEVGSSSSGQSDVLNPDAKNLKPFAPATKRTQSATKSRNPNARVTLDTGQGRSSRLENPPLGVHSASAKSGLHDPLRSSSKERQSQITRSEISKKIVNQQSPENVGVSQPKSSNKDVNESGEASHELEQRKNEIEYPKNILLKTGLHDYEELPNKSETYQKHYAHEPEENQTLQDRESEERERESSSQLKSNILAHKDLVQPFQKSKMSHLKTHELSELTESLRKVEIKDKVIIIQEKEEKQKKSMQNQVNSSQEGKKVFQEEERIKLPKPLQVQEEETIENSWKTCKFLANESILKSRPRIANDKINSVEFPKSSGTEASHLNINPLQPFQELLKDSLKHSAETSKQKPNEENSLPWSHISKGSKSKKLIFIDAHKEHQRERCSLIINKANNKKQNKKGYW
ncbi:hypothetical protein O181_077013 [Austropuccinia psidii MF-1]|uniref:Uncharacterized protein n=1 Tax=Austropuccinia psidii MF-1 TaxID=1389203 RepID=A0A9Q3FG60_9BASI|nr:hypothetical protein [Austropuccinia psidii MF-1]